MKKKSFSQIKEILQDAKKGKMFILVDDDDRENEGDKLIGLVVTVAKESMIAGRDSNSCNDV